MEDKFGAPDIFPSKKDTGLERPSTSKGVIYTLAFAREVKQDVKEIKRMVEAIQRDVNQLKEDQR